MNAHSKYCLMSPEAGKIKVYLNEQGYEPERSVIQEAQRLSKEVRSSSGVVILNRLLVSRILMNTCLNFLSAWDPDFPDLRPDGGCPRQQCFGHRHLDQHGTGGGEEETAERLPRLPDYNAGKNTCIVLIYKFLLLKCSFVVGTCTKVVSFDSCTHSPTLIRSVYRKSFCVKHASTCTMKRSANYLYGKVLLTDFICHEIKQTDFKLLHSI